MRGGKIAAVLATALLLARPAAAQETATGPSPPCELHVWPTRNIDSRSSGWLSHFGMVGAAIDQAQGASANRRNRAAVEEVLDPEAQLRLLMTIDLPGLLAVDPARVVVHAEAVDPAAIRRLRTRRAPSPSTCYSELYVRRIYFHRAPSLGRSLRAEFAFHDFGDAAARTIRLDGEGGDALTQFPPRDEAGIAAAEAELRAVFVRSFRDFAASLRFRTPPRR